MPKQHDLISAAEEVLEERRAALFEPSDPRAFPKIPKDASEELRLEMRELALSSLFYLCKVVLGYTKFRASPHGEFCEAADFVEQNPHLNRTLFLAPRDTYKTSAWTIGRAVQRGCKDPNTRGLILADTGLNATRFGIEIKNHFQFNALLQWLFPEVIPTNFNSVRWNAKELVLNRTAPWRDPTFDMMGAEGGIESRHYDWIIADDLVTEKHLKSDTEMDSLIKWIGGLESLLISDMESRIDFVGSRKKKGDAYEWVEKYFASDSATPQILGPHMSKRGALVTYSRTIRENGKIIFPYDPARKSGISGGFLARLLKHEPERYHAQYENNPRASGLSWFRASDNRFFRLAKDGFIEAVHDGELIERVHPSSLTRGLLYDPSVAERDSSSKQALHIVGKGSSPRIFFLETHYGHIPPDEAILRLFDLHERWKLDFVSIEKRGFQGWVKYALNLIAELKGWNPLPIIEYPPEGSPRAQWAKKEHIRSLQPYHRNHLLWFNEEDDAQAEVVSDFDFYPNVRWDDALDAAAQGTEWWPYSSSEVDRAEAAEKERSLLFASIPGLRLDPRFVEESPEKFLETLDASGYNVRLSFNN